MSQTIDELLQTLQPIGLEEMDNIRLMNRTDRKFLATQSQLIEFLSRAKAGYRVQEHDGTRNASYSTVYFDTPGLDMYLMHHNRHLSREKVRVRRYEDSHLSFFEIKKKNNHGRTKKKRMQVTSYDTIATDGAMQFYADHSNFRFEFGTLKPQLANSFNRITLVNNAQTERLTIDTNLTVSNMVTGIKKSLEGLAIIEVKRDGQAASPSMDILRDLRIFPSGFSKYCIGMALTVPGIKLNNFKTRIRKIEKITSI